MGGLMREDQVRTVVDAVDDAGARYLRAACADAGIDVEDAGVRTPDAIMMLALVGAPAVVSFVVERWHDRLRGGQIIDLRPGAPTVARRDPELLYGLVIVHAVDGTVTIHVHEPRSQTLELVQAVIAALSGRIGASAKDVQGTATEVLGDQASISSADPDPDAP
jgi:hypothetical protein